MKTVTLLLVLLPLAASAATITVNTARDNTIAANGQCTLREAIANVNAAADTSGGDCAAGSGTGDTITFSLSLPATIRLTVHDGLVITQNVIIAGPGADLLAVDGIHRKRVFRITAAAAAISDLTVRNGRVSSPTRPKGGGILVESGSSLNLTNCTVQANQALTSQSTGAFAQGGGMAIEGTASLVNCTFTNNTANGRLGAEGGGGAIAITGAAAITNCKFSGNIARGSNRPNMTNTMEASRGGAIEIAGTATLTNCTLSGNTASGNTTRSGRNRHGFGGGAAISGSATLTNCTLSGNTANGNFAGGGGIGNDGIAILTDCALNGNSSSGGGGGFQNNSSASLTNCTLSGNTAKVYTIKQSGGFYGGGGGLGNAGTVSLTACTLDHNTATYNGGAMYNEGTATLTDCTLRDNTSLGFGGGIANYYPATATLTNCTLSRNRGGGGGGIHNHAAATIRLTNSTLSGNISPSQGAGGEGGGLSNDGLATLTNCTLAGNKASQDGGGIFTTTFASSDTEILNSIVANNEPHDCNAFPPTSNGHNLDGDSTCFSSGSDLSNTPPQLAPLANYGGPTQTLALCTGAGVPDAACTAASPAIDAGDDAVTGPPDSLATDQRGLPRLAGAHVDIGAYEVQQ